MHLKKRVKLIVVKSIMPKIYKYLMFICLHSVFIVKFLDYKKEHLVHAIDKNLLLRLSWLLLGISSVII